MLKLACGAFVHALQGCPSAGPYRQTRSCCIDNWIMLVTISAQLQGPFMQVLERIAEEIDPEGTGLSFDDFLSIVSRMPDFITNFRMAV